MANRKTLAQRLFNITEISTISKPKITYARTTFTRDFLTNSESGEKGFIRRLFHKRAVGESSPAVMFIGERIREKLKGMNITRERIRLDGLISPIVKNPDPMKGISVEDAKKLVRLSQIEMLKSKLKGLEKSVVPYAEFLEICVQNTNQDQGAEYAKMLDESGSVIVLGNIVFLHPEQVTKAIEAIIPISATNPNDPRRKELEEMEKEKVAIDRKAEALVRRELWAGLGYMMVQTAGFMRLTFWELSWDVMEPICFYVTSIYFMAGYTFFLRTAKEPTFEGYFKSRFIVKQKKLMKAENFDVERLNELRRAFYPSSLEPPPPPPRVPSHSGRNLIGA